MSTSKRKRKYAQDFSGHSLTDESFAPACDVNNIVRHYQETGIEPNPERLAEYNRQAKSGETAEAFTLSYEDAMRHKAELDSFIAENPDWQEEAVRAAETALDITPEGSPSESENSPPEPSGEDSQAPQDSTQGRKL